MKNKNIHVKNGLTLIEIIVVITIITILILLAVPNVIRSRIDSNEFAAIANMRTLFNAAQMYYTDNKTYPSALTDMLASSSSPGYIGKKLAETGEKSGYIFPTTRPTETASILMSTRKPLAKPVIGISM